MVVPFPFPAEKWRKMGPEVPEPHVWAGAGAGVHLGGGPSIRSSPDGQDKAIDTPSTLLPVLEVQIIAAFIREMTSVQPKRSLFSASPTERKGCLLLAIGSKKKGGHKKCRKEREMAEKSRNLCVFL